MKKKTIVFTGATGFIGKRLLESMVSLDPHVQFISLVQDKFVHTVKDHIRKLKKKFPDLEYTYRLCNITKPKLGLSNEDYAWLLEITDECFHLAAIYDLSISEELARKVNVKGTEYVLRFCEDAKKNPLLVYFSTCYVSGKRKGTILESELKHPFGFKNFYEKTKFEAELLVQDAIQKVKPIIVVRPGIVVGDSKTGETDKFDGIYAAMNLISKLKFIPLPLPRPGKADSEVNIVPVDYLIDATLYLAQTREKTAGGTYQIADPQPIIAKDLYNFCCKIITGRNSGFPISPKLLEIFLSVKTIRKWLRAPKECVTYFNHPSHYDCSETLKKLEGSGIECPTSKEYFPVLYRFWEEHKDSPGYQAKF